MSAYISALKTIANTAKRFIIKNASGVLLGSAIVGAVGKTTALYADCKNEETIDLVKSAVEEYNNSKALTQKALDSLGNCKLNIYTELEDFSVVMNRIKKMPDNIRREVERIDLPKMNPDIQVSLDADKQTAIAGNIGVVSGSLIGVAMFGMDGISSVSGIALGSVFVCAKGFTLLNKTFKNKEQAVSIIENIESEKAYLDDLTLQSKRLNKTLMDINQVARRHYRKMSSFLITDTDWCDLSNDEKLIVENTGMLIYLLLRICETKLLKNDDELLYNQIDFESINGVIEETEISVKDIANKEFPLPKIENPRVDSVSPNNKTDYDEIVESMQNTQMLIESVKSANFRADLERKITKIAQSDVEGISKKKYRLGFKMRLKNKNGED